MKGIMYAGYRYIHIQAGNCNESHFFRCVQPGRDPRPSRIISGAGDHIVYPRSIYLPPALIILIWSEMDGN